jgi:hypothetical protein
VKIISGGQTGVDRGALDTALKHGIECGGWCPAGRVDEFGTIPGKYPVTEIAQGGYDDRTLQNVKDSDATLVLCNGEPRGGTRFTLECCKQLERPCHLIDATRTSLEKAAEGVGDFVAEHSIKVLNVAGPRESEWPGGYRYASGVLELFFKACSGGL